MIADDTRKRLENIVRGTIIEGEEDTCTTIRNFLCAGFSTSTTVKREFESRAIEKEKQAAVIKSFCEQNNLWLNSIPQGCRFLTRGGEAEVYLASDNKKVIKINDAVYYATWLEFFNSIIIHNILFNDTAYNLEGFIEQNNVLKAVVTQLFITSAGPVYLSEIKALLAHNGFENTRRNDYYNREFGLILEDMHDQNVIANANTLFFIDTVFYTAYVN